MDHLLEQFVSILTLVPSIWRPLYSKVDTIEKMAAVRAEAGVQMVLFNSTLGAAKVAIEMLRKLQRLVGQVERVTELLELLQKVDSMKTNETAAALVDGEQISFEGVDVVTPAGVKLVENLSFTVQPATESKHPGSLLLVGHNGAGKSSIFRCMAGLWAIPSGRITKPGGPDGCGTAVYYLPQRPYQVIGTLAEQLTYPDTKSAASFTREDLRTLLAQVELSYLLDRAGIDEEVNWEEEIRWFSLPHMGLRLQTAQ
eukprot:SAG31_NODE_770_length_12217_cov_2.855174_3_plen_256_part_00